MDIFEHCHFWATVLYAQDHPEVHDPRLPFWALERHVDECQKLEDELISAELGRYDDEIAEKQETWYGKLLLEEIAAVDEAVRENGHYPLEPAYDPSRPDRERDEFLEEARRCVESFEVFGDNYGVDEMNAQWEREYEEQIAEEVEADGECPPEPEYDPSLDNDEWPDCLVPEDWRVAMS